MRLLLSIKNIYFFLFVSLIYTGTSIVSNNLFLSEDTFAQWYDGILSVAQIRESVAFAQKWQWVTILISLLLVLLRIVCVAGCLYLGLFFFADGACSYKTGFNVALKAEMILVAYTVVRLCWYGFVHTPASIGELQVAPLSLMCFFDPSQLEAWLLYPLNTLNVFEVFYVLTLAGLMATAVKSGFRKAVEIVFVSYGAGLLLMMAAQMFLILNLQS